MKLRITTKNVHTIPLYVFQKIDFTGFSLRRDHPEAWNLIMLWSYVKRDKKSLLATVHQLLKINLRTEERSCNQPTVVYRQLGDSNSQWHKTKLQKVPVGGSAGWGMCQFGEVPVPPTGPRRRLKSPVHR